ncbi:MAG TPA: dual specificity protein phosphatase [Ktedonobacterales bacterium]|nr:dual specificity protein phosphatase [Ktedonobacterales bacterium]
MSASQRVHLFAFPYHHLLFDAYLESAREEYPTPPPASNGSADMKQSKRATKRHKQIADGADASDLFDIVFDFRALELTGQPRLYVIGSQPYEQVNGLFRPLRLRFHRARWRKRTGVFTDLTQLNEVPAEHEARRLMGALHVRTPEDGEFFYIQNASTEYAELSFFAQGYSLEERAEPDYQASYLRRWSYAPPAPAGITPHRPRLYQRFAGDPIAVRLGRRTFSRRLFIGGVIMQGPERPAVDHVLNLCDIPNPWLAQQAFSPADRLSCQGEMALGMRLDDLRTEAEWVVERLRQGRSVLVHCYAGINRSATVCCAALILLEGLTPEQALARVRRSRPNAQPDPYHWFILQRLAEEARGEYAPIPFVVESARHNQPIADQAGSELTPLAPEPLDADDVRDERDEHALSLI